MLRLSIFGRFRAADALGNEIPIKSKKARALLAYLALPPGKERSREEVMALLWSERGDEQARSSLRQALSGLRKELGEGAVGGLKVTDEWLALDPGLVAIEPASPGDVLLSGLHISDPAFDEWLRDERLRHEDVTAPYTHTPEPSLPDKPSIAVLPFVNMSGDVEQEYFSDGITEDIITALSRFGSLFVIARSSSFRYKGQNPKVQDVGHELGVEYVVEGSVRKAGDHVRISAQLVEAATGKHLWAERYDRDLDDIFQVQDEVVEAIVSILPLKLSHAELARASRKPTDNLTAYDYLLRGEWYLYKDYGDPKSLTMFEKAVELDPGCARAYAQMAVYHLYSFFVVGALSEEKTKRAREYVERALSIDNDDSSVHWIASLAYLLLGEHDLAKNHSEWAIALNPNDVSAIRQHGFVMGFLGDPHAGLEQYRKAQRLDPYEPESNFEDWIDLYYMSRQYEKAIEVFGRWHNPRAHNYSTLAACYAQLDRADEARAAVEQFERARLDTYDFSERAQVGRRMCAREEDADHWMEGYRKAGFDV